MADRLRGLIPLIAAALVGAAVLLPLAAVIWRAGGLSPLDGRSWDAVWFTLWQAALSAALSVGLAVPVARALARRRFRGRAALVALLGAPFILPVIVAILGLLAVFGQKGWLSDGLALFGLPAVKIYGLHGVLLAHVFFNLPLATRLLLQGWRDIPAERFRLAATLGFRPWTMFRLIEWPMLRRIAPGAAMVIFVICLSSFAVALTLGGGPKATTVELAIYQAFRFDFDIGKAAQLAVVQLVLAGAAALVAMRLTLPEAGFGGLDRIVPRWDGSRLLDGFWIALVALFLLLPLAAIGLRGAGALVSLPASVWQAALYSVCVSLGAVLVTLTLALPLALSRRKWVELVGLLGIASSPLVLGTGLYLMINPFIAPWDVALPVTAAVNAVMALPFVLRILRPAAAQIEAEHGRLADSLDLHGLARLRWLVLPRLRRPLGFAAGLTGALAMGDLGVITLFADPDTATLPLQMYRLMGAYRMDQAAGAALLLLILSFGLFWIFDRGGRARADT